MKHWDPVDLDLDIQFHRFLLDDEQHSHYQFHDKQPIQFSTVRFQRSGFLLADDPISKRQQLSKRIKRMRKERAHKKKG